LYTITSTIAVTVTIKYQLARPEIAL
jgi:hypothetical protein